MRSTALACALALAGSGCGATGASARAEPTPSTRDEAPATATAPSDAHADAPTDPPAPEPPRLESLVADARWELRGRVELEGADEDVLESRVRPRERFPGGAPGFALVPGEGGELAVWAGAPTAFRIALSARPPRARSVGTVEVLSCEAGSVRLRSTTDDLFVDVRAGRRSESRSWSEIAWACVGGVPRAAEFMHYPSGVGRFLWTRDLEHGSANIDDPATTGVDGLDVRWLEGREGLLARITYDRVDLVTVGSAGEVLASSALALDGLSPDPHQLAIGVSLDRVCVAAVTDGALAVVWHDLATGDALGERAEARMDGLGASVALVASSVDGCRFSVADERTGRLVRVALDAAGEIGLVAGPDGTTLLLEIGGETLALVPSGAGLEVHALGEP